ncbi:NfeD family protein [Candidatus Magnetaquicoccus inordinatus]|uniref:NfeD family protein n=1 Tax=Candidatus Magnetaquicoccus inordinatus TaxID=2496818 RepID=UPI00102C82C2|nr:NfeD family protein [Candidatus Magnetaquicoccus inordinatus]
MNHPLFALLNHLNHWHWGLLAAALTLLELLLPISLFLWMGVAAAVVSGTLFFWPSIGWQSEIMLFLFIFAASTALSRMRFVRPKIAVRPLPKPPQAVTTHRASQYVGRLFTLTQPIRDGVGTLQIGNTLWTIRGLDLSAGTQVKITGFEGSVLAVEALEEQPSRHNDDLGWP